MTTPADRNLDSTHERPRLEDIELSGSSQKSIEGAIQTAISRAAKSLKNSRWCKPAAYRRRQVQHYEVFLKFGFTVEDAREE